MLLPAILQGCLLIGVQRLSRLLEKTRAARLVQLLVGRVLLPRRLGEVWVRLCLSVLGLTVGLRGMVDLLFLCLGGGRARL